MVPISYSVAHEQLHHVLATYKRRHGPTPRRFTVELAAVLWRHLVRHEACLARAAGISNFDLVTTVPSSDPERDETQPLREIVGQLVLPSRGRYRHVLRRTGEAVATHTFGEHKFETLTELSGRRVLLIDDTWTTGANAQSAASALKRAGAACVASVVIGRHVNRDWRQNDRLLRALENPFDWDRCALCRPQSVSPGQASERRLVTDGGG
jgi:predicted amidophosphoribosyltransferase